MLCFRTPAITIALPRAVLGHECDTGSGFQIEGDAVGDNLHSIGPGLGSALNFDVLDVSFHGLTQPLVVSGYFALFFETFD